MKKVQGRYVCTLSLVALVVGSASGVAKAEVIGPERSGYVDKESGTVTGATRNTTTGALEDKGSNSPDRAQQAGNVTSDTSDTSGTNADTSKSSSDQQAGTAATSGSSTSDNPSGTVGGATSATSPAGGGLGASSSGRSY